jgi:hypothetical protein
MISTIMGVPEAFPWALASARYVPKSATLAIVSNQVKEGIFATDKAFAFVVASEMFAAAAATWIPNLISMVDRKYRQIRTSAA